MDRFRELQIFIAVVDEGGFAKAANKLGLSAPSITRTVQELEARLGTTLLIRTTRSITLTDSGAGFIEDAREILDRLRLAEARAQGSAANPVGHLRLTAPVLFGEQFVAPLVRSYLDLHTDMTVSTLFVDRNINLAEEGVDIALRIGDLADSGLTARRLGQVRTVVVASPDYLETAPPLEVPEQLAAHRIILPVATASASAWEFVRGRQKTVAKFHAAFQTNMIRPAINAAVEGWGVTRVLSYQVADLLESGELVEVLADFDDRKLPVHILHREGRSASAKVRTFVDLAVGWFGARQDRLLASDEL